MHLQRIAVMISSIIGMLGAFLPWATLNFMGITVLSVSGVDAGHGWIVVGTFIPVFVISLMGDRTQPIKGNKVLISTVFAVLSMGVAVWGILNVSKLGASTKIPTSELGKIPFAKMSIGYGLYFIIAMGIAVIVSAFIFADSTPEKEEKPSASE